MDLYDAVTLASKQPPSREQGNSRTGPQYCMFGARGAPRARRRRRRTARCRPPVSTACCPVRMTTKADLLAGLPAGVDASEGQIVVVPRGTVVLQAIPANFSKPTPIGDPSAQFFVLKDNVALRRQRHHQPAAEHGFRQRPAGRHVRVQQQGQVRVPERDRGDRPPRRAGQRPWPAGQPALRGRAGQPADHGSVHRATSSTRTGSTATTAPTSAAASRSARRRTWPTSCAWARSRSTSS